jgi:hypothetical protein
MSTASPSESANLPIYTRKATGMVREIPMLDQSVFNATSGPPVGVIIFGLFALLVFPQSNIYVTAILAPVFGVFVWATFALMAAASSSRGSAWRRTSAASSRPRSAPASGPPSWRRRASRPRCR